MDWNYRKRITIAPGIRLNVSKKGISTTLGMRDASINIGRNETYLNTGIPSTGIYSRKKISGGKQTVSPSSKFSNTKSNRDITEGRLITLEIAVIIGLCAYNFALGLIVFVVFCFIMIIAKDNSSKAKKIELSIQSQIETAKNALNQISSSVTTVKRKEISFDAGVFNYIKFSFDIPM